MITEDKEDRESQSRGNLAKASDDIGAFRNVAADQQPLARLGPDETQPTIALGRGGVIEVEIGDPDEAHGLDRCGRLGGSSQGFGLVGLLPSEAVTRATKVTAG